MEVGDIGILAVIAAGTYLLGSFPTAYVVVNRFAGKHIMQWGTGNVGTLNVHRATGSKLLTLLTLVGDVIKGVLALVAGFAVASALGVDSSVGALTGGILAAVGHNYSAFLRLQGGKRIATALPILFYIEPLLVAVWLGTYLLTVAATRIFVLGQILGTVVVPLVCYVFFPDHAVPVTILGLIVFIRHAPRIPNVVKGTEPKLYYKIDKTREA